MKKKIDFNKYITEHITDILGEDSIQKGYLKKFQKNFAALDMKMNELIGGQAGSYGRPDLPAWNLRLVHQSVVYGESGRTDTVNGCIPLQSIFHPVD